MKYFICNLDMINNNTTGYLGIPAEKTERIIPVNRVQTVVYETENQEAFFSLPVLFQLKDRTTVHGLVLKPEASCGMVKTILMTPRINTEIEIPEENIHRLPESMTETLVFFRGVCFDDKNMILILDPEKLPKGTVV